VLWPRQQAKLARGAKDKEHAISYKRTSRIAVIGAIMLRQKWSRGQVETQLANLPPCLICMEACGGFGERLSIVRLSAKPGRRGGARHGRDRDRTCHDPYEGRVMTDGSTQPLCSSFRCAELF
jgi:hypothetical protein